MADEERPEVQPWTAHLYSTIENWWGEEVSMELARKVASAPQDQLSCFLEEVHSAKLKNYSSALPPMKRGTLRPLVGDNPFVRTRGFPGDNVSVALRLLLYVHEVAIESDFLASLFSDAYRFRRLDIDREYLQRALVSLAALRPFIHQGIVHFTPVRGPALHSSNDTWDSAIDSNSDVQNVVRRLVREVGIYSDDYEQTEEDFLERVLPLILGTTKLALQRMSEGKANPLTRTAAEREFVNALLSATGIGDRRRPLVDSLARLPVPDFVNDPKLLVQLRNSDHKFAHWREALGNALTQLGEMPDTADLHQASDIVWAELQSTSTDIRTSVGKSSALSAARQGVVQFGVGAIGAVAASEAVTGNPLAGLVSVASAQSANTVINYLKALREKRSDRLILALTASFETQTSD